MDLEGQYNGGVVFIEIGEPLDGEYNILKQNRGSGGVAMLNNGSCVAIMDINFDTPQTILQIDQISLNPTVAEQLVSCQIGVMGGVAVVMIKWFFLVNFEGHVVVV